MKRNFMKLLVGLVVFSFSTTGILAAEPKLPVVKGKKAVATVNGEVITFEEFQHELAGLNQGKAKEEKPGEKEQEELLRRLINSRLMIQEARRIGIDQLPEIKNMVDVYSRVTLREELIERQLKDVKPDEKEADEIYKELVKEWKIKSVLFEKEDDVKKMDEEIKAGGSFDDLAKQAVSDGKAKGGEEGTYVSRKDFLPQVAEVVFKMEVGSISPVIPLKSGSVILKLEDVRYPENPEAKERATLEALNRKRGREFQAYCNAMAKKYARINKKILDNLDFESQEPGFEKLLKDKRVVAEIKGEKPITVGDLTESIRQQFFHGIQRALESKRVNEKKVPVFEDMLYKRLFRKEALSLRIDKMDEYKNKVKEYEESVVFGAFVQKTVVPDIKLNDNELKSYYKEHVAEYTYPEMMKINGLAFFKRGDAEETIEKLRKGTDFQWVSANADGQVEKDAKDLLSFEEKLLSTKGLPQAMQKVVSGARPGDYKLYASPEGYFYVLFIQEVVPAKPQPYETVKQDISKLIFNDKLKEAVEDYADKLRAVSDIKIYLKPEE